MATTPKTAFDAAAKFIGKYDKKFIAQTLNGLDFLPQVKVQRRASLNGMLLPKMTVAEGARPLDLSVETRAGNHRSYSGRKLFVYPGMKIIDIIPEEVYNTFLSDMAEPGAKEIPFAQWVWEQEFAKLASEINDNIYLSDYKGDAADFNAGTAYAVNDYMKYGTERDIYKCVTITTAGQTPDTHPAKWLKVNGAVISTGWGTIIQNEITGGAISGANLIATGAVTASNAMDKVEAVVNGMTVAHREKGGIVRVSPVVYDNYIKHEKSVFTAALNQKMGDGEKTVYGKPKWLIKQANWMGNSSRIIATQKDNLVFGTNVENDMTGVGKLIETLHGYKTVVKWLQGCEIADLETFYTNDQA